MGHDYGCDGSSRAGDGLAARQSAAQRKSATLALGDVTKRRGLLQQFRLLLVAERSVVAQHPIGTMPQQLAHALSGRAVGEPQRGAGLAQPMHADWVDAYLASLAA